MRSLMCGVGKGARLKRVSLWTALALVVLGGCSASTRSGATPATSPTPRAPTPVPGSSSRETSPSTTSTVAASQLTCVAALPLRERVGQLLMFAADASELSTEAAQFAKAELGGALLQDVGAHLSSRDVEAFRTATAIPMMIAVDEEGGEVQRLSAEAGPLPSENAVAATMTPTAAEAMIAAHARAVAKLGITVVFAPVVDVSPRYGNGPMGTRTFGHDPQTTIRFARAYVTAWQAAGILPVLKHFPGHGSASGDTHTGAATVPPLAALRTDDLLPYYALARDSSDLGVMVAHVIVPGLTSGPSSLDPAAYHLLRDDVRFRGVAFTDALNMAAVARTRSMPAAAVAAIEAGADVALLMDVRDAPATIAALTGAAGTILPFDQLNASVLRVLRAKHVDPCTIE